MSKKSSIFDEIRRGFDVEKDFTFDLNKARVELNSSDPISVILRGHLYIENCLDEMLKMELKYPELIDLSKINFAIKPKLCCSMGIIDQRTSNICLKINKVRNSLAHHLDCDINETVWQDLFEEYYPQFRDKLLSELKTENNKKSGEDNFTKFIARLVRDFVALLQSMRRGYEIFLEEKTVAFKHIKEFIEDGENLESSNINADKNA